MQAIKVSPHRGSFRLFSLSQLLHLGGGGGFQGDEIGH
jgi:hypothetical protein